MITGGRTEIRHPLLVHTLVSVGRYDPLFAAGLAPEARSLYEQATSHGRCSVAELSAGTGMPFGVTRVLLADLAASDRLVIHPSRQPATDLDILERLRDGLAQLV